jgi:predicted GIY-YIG superfamily endonuclease
MTIPYQISIINKKHMNLFEFKHGGIYKITCIKNNKVYIGQTDCFVRRCFQHLKLFKDKKHNCLKLQEYVTIYGLDSFKFEIIVKENNFKKRLQLEKKYIKNTLETLLYNPIKKHNFKTNPRVAQRIKIHDIIYPSIREASRQINESTRNIGLKLNDISNTNYQRLDYHKNIYFDTYKVKINDNIFESTRSVVNAGLAKTTRQVRDRCKSKNWSNWELIENRSNDYPARE